MRNLVKCSLLAIVLGTAATAAAQDIEFHGYARAGVGLAAQGGGQVCFGLGAADTKYRLGNECDYVIEPTFTSRFVKMDDKSAWGIVFMPSFYRTYAELEAFDNLPVRFGQLYLFGESVPYLANGKVWGGRRFYDRLQTGINDQFLENEDGDGAGIEDMDVRIGRLSVAFLMNPNDESTTIEDSAGDPVPTNNLRRYKVTSRLTGIKTAKEGALQIWAGYIADSTSDNTEGPTPVPTPRGDEFFRLGVYHTLNNIFGGPGGSNLLGVKGEYGPNHRLWRVVLQHGAMIGPRTGVDFLTEYRSAQDRTGSDAEWVNSDWFTIGARTDTHIVGPFRFLLEAGHDLVKPETGDTMHLTKVTAAAAVSSGPTPGSRPTFRLFYTPGFWNEAAQGPGGVYDHWQSGARLKEVYGDATNGGSFGIQAEAWW